MNLGLNSEDIQDIRDSFRKDSSIYLWKKGSEVYGFNKADC